MTKTELQDKLAETEAELNQALADVSYQQELREMDGKVMAWYEARIAELQQQVAERDAKLADVYRIDVEPYALPIDMVLEGPTKSWRLTSEGLTEIQHEGADQ